jgi:hypothetical protein
MNGYITILLPIAFDFPSPISLLMLDMRYFTIRFNNIHGNKKIAPSIKFERDAFCALTQFLS